ncbi:MAG: replication factor C large subunit [Candidatus Aenigmatarchaeota archaeon]
MLWADKYEPESLKDFAGQNKQLEKLKEWYENWNPGDDALLLHGPPGDGKTSSVYALAGDKDLDLFEINASDDRNRKDIEGLAGSASQQRSLLRREKIILVDEVDGLSGRKDRGGVGAIIDVIKKSKFPVVLTANDPYDSKLRNLRRYCELVDFGKVHLSSMTAKLAQICEEEGVKADRKLLKRIARSNSGDLRSAINDLEAVARGKDKITKDDLEALGYRDRERGIFEVMKVIFKTKTAKTAKDMAGDSEKDPDELFWWIEENVPNEYKKEGEVAQAFDELSKADLIKARIRRRQNWALMKYYIGLMAAGVALSKEEKYKSFTKYRPPQRLKKYGRTKGTRKKLDGICEKLNEGLHLSSSKIKMEYFPLLKWLVEMNETTERYMKENLGLDDEEIEIIQDF